MQPDFTKQFRLGIFKEVNVSAVKDDARCVDVAPSNAFFNREFLVLRHSTLRLTQKAKKSLIKLLCPLHVRNMSRVVQHNQTRTLDRVMHFLAVSNMCFRVSSTTENQRRHGDLR